jgi:hypothetical protein
VNQHISSSDKEWNTWRIVANLGVRKDIGLVLWAMSSGCPGKDKIFFICDGLENV